MKIWTGGLCWLVNRVSWRGEVHIDLCNGIASLGMMSTGLAELLGVNASIAQKEQDTLIELSVPSV